MQKIAVQTNRGKKVANFIPFISEWNLGIASLVSIAIIYFILLLFILAILMIVPGLTTKLIIGGVLLISGLFLPLLLIRPNPNTGLPIMDHQYLIFQKKYKKTLYMNNAKEKEHIRVVRYETNVIDKLKKYNTAKVKTLASKKFKK